MSDMFASYGLEAAPPRRNEPGSAREEKAPSALEKKMLERRRLTAQYRMLKREERIAVLEAEPRLRDFMRYLRRIGPDDGDELIEAVSTSWLPAAPANVRHHALSLVDRRCEKIRVSLGLPGLDDPLPPETSVFFEVRDVLGRGR